MQESDFSMRYDNWKDLLNVVEKLFDLQILYAFAQFINSEINISLKFPCFDLMVFSLIIIKVYKQIMDQKL